MHTQFYLIKPLSNLHVGSGDVSFGVVDNLIQRDVLNNLPNINSSSLKGAIREFCKYSELETFEKIFGSDTESDKKTKGSFRFFDANILAIPVRSEKMPYLMATSISILNEFIYKVRQFGITASYSDKVQRLVNAIGKVEHKQPIVFTKQLENAVIEELDYKAALKEIEDLSALENLIGSNIVILSDDNMHLICDNNHLPVIARNHLENGISTNLWYEQVLPRYTRLYFAVVGYEQADFKDFDIKIQESPVSIGANASIGYGYCKIEKLEYDENK